MRIVDVTLTGKTLCFSDGTTREASAKECSYFKRRKKLIAYPIKVKDADGSPVLAEDGTPKERYEIIRWADIHRHSWYSLLDGCTSIKNMVSHTEGAGGITDHGVMCGVMQFYAAMKKAEKIPIVGQEFYCETINGEKKGNHLILLAKNETGYKNLVKLSSMAYDNFYYKPHISYEMLEAHHEGLICSSACIGGEIPQMFLAAEKNPEDAEEYIAKANVIIAWFRRVFGDDFYLEVQRHGIADEDLVMPKIIQYARENNIHMIATTDSHYVSKEDHEAHDVLLCIATGKTFADEKRMKFEGTGYHLHTADEVEDLFFDIPDALDNTLEIVKKCAGFHITTGKYYLPKYPVPDGYEDEYSYLDKLAHDGFKVRYAGIRRTKKWQEYSERLEYELSVIKKMGFAGYFLIVWDFLNFAHENGIPTGPGRGSGAGSIVLYSLQITDIDPMKYGLLFERFLNPSRISMPDIDSDISEKQREKVIQYVTRRYGSDHVAHIVTFGTLAAKSALRDTAKVFGLTPAEAQKISNMVPDGPKVTIEDALGENPEFRLFSQSTEINRKIVSVAKTLEGTPRNLSTHACGIVISQDAVTEYVPELITRDKITQEATLSTQYNMTECEDAGTLKMDFLGLRTLDVIDSTLKQIKRNHPEIQWTTNTIPFTSPKIYKFLGSGKTDGVFQLESPGMRKLLKDMYKDVRSRTDTEEKGEEYFERLIAVVALYRPGPMDEIPNYIKAMKSGNVHYDHPKLKNILSNTYGVLVYQEQIMFAVRELAGFSAADADKVRKAMG